MRILPRFCDTCERVIWPWQEYGSVEWLDNYDHLNPGRHPIYRCCVCVMESLL